MEENRNPQNEQNASEGKRGVFSRMGSSLSNKGKSMVGYDSIKKGWDDISENAKILNPFRRRPPPKRGEETFGEAYARNKLSESALSRIYRNQLISFNVSIAFAVICLILAVNFFMSKGFFSMMSALGPLLVCLSLAVASSFKMMKIRKRNLAISFDEWKNSPSEWLPKKFIPLKKKKKPSSSTPS